MRTRVEQILNDNITQILLNTCKTQNKARRTLKMLSTLQLPTKNKKSQ